MINNNCPLVLSNLFEYDFSACSYNILKNIGWDMSKIEKENKSVRNIQIGCIQRDNPPVSQYITSTINNLIDYYLRENQVNESEVILRQKDGVTLTKRLRLTNLSMPLTLTGVISKLIIDVTRKKWLIVYSSGDVIVKGINNKVKNKDFFKLFRNLNYSNKSNLISGLEKIRQSIFSGSNINWFLQEEDDGSFSVPIINVGFIKISKSALSSLRVDDVDRYFLWEEYVWPFVESILIHCSN